MNGVFILQASLASRKNGNAGAMFKAQVSLPQLQLVYL